LLVCGVGHGSANVTVSPTMSTDDLYAAYAKCLDTYGVSAEYIRFQNNMTTAQDLRDACNNSEKYQQASQCIRNVTASISSDDLSATSFEQSVRDSQVSCGDPKISFECLAEYSRNMSQVQSCINSHWTLTDLISRSSQEISCYGRKLSIQCATEFLQRCDAYTATTMETRMKLSTPVVCYFYQDLVG
ncbi:unnamed protein product, partial [Candidula unifasciata]